MMKENEEKKMRKNVNDRRGLMKKKYILIIFIFLIIFIWKFLDYYNQEKSKKYEEYCIEINKILNDKDFYIAKISNNNIVLYDDINEDSKDVISFSKYNKFLKIIYIRKEKERTFFVIKAALDDEKGYVIFNNSNILDGINAIERVNGEMYQYSTIFQNN